MLDATLRPWKDRALRPLARGPLGRLHPHTWSAISLVLSLVAAHAAWQGRVTVSVVAWVLGRVGDGLDGLVARESGRASDRGGLLDIVLDAVSYAVIPIALAAHHGTNAAWIAVAFLLATFYVNSTSWAYLAALLEKRGLGAAHAEIPTSAHIPRGFVEGSETIIFFTVALAFPSASTAVWWVMAASVAATALERVWWAWRMLR